MRGMRRHPLLRGPLAGLLAGVLGLSAALAGAHDHGLCARTTHGPELDVPAQGGAEAPTSCPACKLSTERARDVGPQQDVRPDGPQGVAPVLPDPFLFAAPARDAGSPRAPPASPSLVP